VSAVDALRGRLAAMRSPSGGGEGGEGALGLARQRGGRWTVVGNWRSTTSLEAAEEEELGDQDAEEEEDKEGGGARERRWMDDIGFGERRGVGRGGVAWEVNVGDVGVRKGGGEAVTSPFSAAASTMSGISGDGNEGFFPPMPAGEGFLLEERDEGAGVHGKHGQGAEGKENMFFGADHLLQDEEQGSLSLPSSAGSLRHHSDCFLGGVLSRQPSGMSNASTGSGGGSQRTLHDKLMSPERHRRPRPDEVQRKHDEKLRLALERKEALEALRQEKLRGAEILRQDKLRQLRERRENFQCHMDQRLRRAQELRQAKVLEKQLKAQRAGDRGVKQEIAFIELLNAESKTSELQHRLESAEARRLLSLEATARSSEKAARQHILKSPLYTDAL